MALTGFKVLASSGFEKEIIMVDFLGKTMFDEAHLQVLLKEGILGKKLKFFQKDIGEVEIVDEQETSSDAGQRVKNAAVGVVLMGPIGLLGAVIGGAKKHVSLKLSLPQDKKLLIEVPSKDCTKIFNELLKIDLNQFLNQSKL